MSAADDDAPENALDAEGLECTRCGRCCAAYGDDLRASPADLARWRDDAPHLLGYADPASGDLWLDPHSGARLARCPWHERDGSVHGCAIHDTRPESCRGYPFSLLQAAFDGCEALTPGLRVELGAPP